MPFSWTRRNQNISKNHNLYLYQSKITLPGLLWDTLYLHSQLLWWPQKTKIPFTLVLWPSEPKGKSKGYGRQKNVGFVKGQWQISSGNFVAFLLRGNSTKVVLLNWLKSIINAFELELILQLCKEGMRLENIEHIKKVSLFRIDFNPLHCVVVSRFSTQVHTYM